MKIVLDTNVLVSALIKKGKPRTLLYEILRKHQLILSREILEEFVRVTADPKIRRYANEKDIRRFLQDIATRAKIIRIRSNFSVVYEDPNDDLILRTCYDAKAGYVVSGDRHLLELGKYRRIKIVTINEMLETITSKTMRAKKSRRR